MAKLILTFWCFFCVLLAYGQQNENLFPVKVKGKWGFINVNGAIVIEPRFEYAFLESNINVNIVKDDLGYFLVDNKGVEFSQERYSDFSYCNDNGTINFKNKEEKWGTLDTNGKVVIPFEYTELNCFSDGIATASKDNKTYGFIDEKNHFTALPEYDQISNLNEGFILTMKYRDKDNYSCGLYSTEAMKAVIPPIYGSIKEVRKGHAIVVDTLYKNQGIIDVKTGNYSLLLADQSISVSDKFSIYEATFRGDLIYSIKKKGKTYLTDYNGKERVQLNAKTSKYAIWNFYNGYAMTLKDNKYGLIDIHGKLVIPHLYDAMQMNASGLVAVMRNKKWGYVNLAGNTVIPFVYDYAFPAVNGLLQVYVYNTAKDWSDIDKEDSDCQMGYLDLTGKVIWKPSL